MNPLKNHRDVSRLESFSDAIFAFSATLLVVSLEVPRTFEQLIAELQGFGAFALSFAALVLIWTSHSAYFRRFGLNDSITVLLNSILMFVVLFFVYPLKFVSQGMATLFFGMGEGVGITSIDELGTLFTLYGGGFIAVFLCLALMYGHAARVRDRAGEDSSETRYARYYFRQYMLFVTVGVVSVVLASTGLGLRMGMPGWIYGLIGPIAYIHGSRFGPDKKTQRTNAV